MFEVDQKKTFVVLLPSLSCFALVLTKIPPTFKEVNLLIKYERRVLLHARTDFTSLSIDDNGENDLNQYLVYTGTFFTLVSECLSHDAGENIPNNVYLGR